MWDSKPARDLSYGITSTGIALLSRDAPWSRPPGTPEAHCSCLLQFVRPNRGDDLATGGTRRVAYRLSIHGHQAVHICAGSRGNSPLGARPKLMPRQKSTHVDDPVLVGRRLREARERAGLSQRALSFLGCTPAYISRIEAGQRIASLQLLTELGRRLGVSASYLATGRESDDVESTAAMVDAEVAVKLDEPETARPIYEQVLAESNVPSLRSRALEGLGQIAFRDDDPERAVELFQQALRETGETEADRPSLASTLARSYALLGRMPESIAVLETCVRRYESDPIQYVRFAGLLGAALSENGSIGEAERILADALSRGREMSDPYRRAGFYWSESRLRAARGEKAEAAKAARSALDTLRASEDTRAIAQAHHLLAHVYLSEGKARDALDLLREGEPLVSGSATPFELAQYRIEQARSLAALGESEQARTIATSVLSELRGLHAVDSGRAYLLLATVYDDLGDDERAGEVLGLAVETLEPQPPTRHLVQAYKQLADSLKRAGRTDDAFRLLERALNVQEHVGPAVA
jgi:tetratricopeptide (TPR) repeat protein